MPTRRYELLAEVRSADPGAIEPALRRLVDGEITATATGFRVSGTLTGASARDLNRALLAALRRVERRTSLRATWTSTETSERFFDYVPKGPTTR